MEVQTYADRHHVFNWGIRDRAGPVVLDGRVAETGSFRQLLNLYLFPGHVILEGVGESVAAFGGHLHTDLFLCVLGGVVCCDRFRDLVCRLHTLVVEILVVGVLDIIVGLDLFAEI